MAWKNLIYEAVVSHETSIKAKPDAMKMADHISRLVEQEASRERYFLVGPDAEKNVEKLAADLHTELGDPVDDEGDYDAAQFVEALEEAIRRARS